MSAGSENRVTFFDTTLRDGEQSPGATMTSSEKTRIAGALARLGVDVIEAGFPAASPDDLAAVRDIARGVGDKDAPPVICGLARAKESDIEACWTAVKHARRPRIHTFLATSPIHREYKLRMTRSQVLERIRSMVAFAKERCEDIEFSAEDAGRTEPEFLYEAIAAAIANGATTVNIPDTVGYTLPDDFGALIAGIREHVPASRDIVISVHCHDDLGLAVANTLAGIRNGARQAEVTINAIGERAGNASLEELAMILRTRRDALGFECGITPHIVPTSRLVSRITGMAVQPNKAIVGANAFAHESGIHQDGMLKNNTTYEIMRPEDVGAVESLLVLGKHSGRAALKEHLARLGIFVEGEALKAAFVRFKDLADQKKTVTEADLRALVESRRAATGAGYVLQDLQVSYPFDDEPRARVELVGPDGTLHRREATGHGPVEAAFSAIQEIVQAPCTLSYYQVHAVTEGKDALAQACVHLRSDATAGFHPQSEEERARVWHGLGADIDVLIAGARAYVAALNQMLEVTQSEAPVEGALPQRPEFIA